jgi:hypothetical protein
MNLRARILLCWLATIAAGVATHFFPVLPNILPGLVFLSFRYLIPMLTPKLKSTAVMLFLAANFAAVLTLVIGITGIGGRGSAVVPAVAAGLLGMAFLLVMVWSDFYILCTGRRLA